MILNALKNGINKGFACWRVIFTLWFLNFLFSLILFLPTNTLLSKVFSKSLIPERMVKGDVSIFFEFMIIYKSEIGLLFIFSLSLFSIYWLVNLFLSGGIISMIKKDRNDIRELFSKSSVYFWRFFKLFLLFIPIAILFFIIWGLLGKLRELLFNLTGSEKFTFYFSLFTILTGILIFLIMRILFDYGRIRIAFEEEKVITISLLRTMKWFLENFWKTFFLYLILTILLLFYYIPLYFISKISSSSPILILMIFLLSQILLLFRSFLSFLFYSSQYELYRCSKI